MQQLSTSLSTEASELPHCIGGLFSLAAPSGVHAVTLDQACQTFAGKLSAAQKAGDTQKAQEIYSVGSKRVAKKFNGATCPNVAAPTP